MTTFISKRQEGNTAYLAATAADNANNTKLWKKSKFEEALLAFEIGKGDARDYDDVAEMVKCARSIGITALAYASSCQSNANLPKVLEHNEILLLFKRAISNFTFAISKRPSDCNGEWLNGVILKTESAVRELQAYVCEALKSWQERVAALEKILTLVSDSGKVDGIALSLLHLVIADEIYKAIVVADEDSNWRECLGLTAEISRSLQCIRPYWARGTDGIWKSKEAPIDFDLIFESLAETESSCQFYYARSKAKQFLASGEVLLNQLLCVNENFDMDLAFVCLDQFSAALQMLRKEKDRETFQCYETAAIVSSKIGVLYSKCFKTPDRGHLYFLQAIQFADIVKQTTGAVFFSKDWYQTAKREVEAHRETMHAKTLAEAEKVRAPIIAKLKPIIKAIDDCLSGSPVERIKKLLTHIYKEHPPKKVDAKLDKFEKNDCDEGNKLALKAVAHYHPDANKENGDEWKILCEEISKRINNVYESMKN